MQYLKEVVGAVSQNGAELNNKAFGQGGGGCVDEEGLQHGTKVQFLCTSTQNVKHCFYLNANTISTFAIATFMKTYRVGSQSGIPWSVKSQSHRASWSAKPAWHSWHCTKNKHTKPDKFKLNHSYKYFTCLCDYKIIIYKQWRKQTYAYWWAGRLVLARELR